jgi:hypothetical protein
MAHSSAQSLVWSARVAGVAAIAITTMATAAIVMTRRDNDRGRDYDHGWH